MSEEGQKSRKGKRNPSLAEQEKWLKAAEERRRKEDARIRELTAQINVKKRKRHNRFKMLIGVALLEALDKGETNIKLSRTPTLSSLIRSLLDQHITSDHDRAFLDSIMPELLGMPLMPENRPSSGHPSAFKPYETPGLTKPRPISSSISTSGSGQEESVRSPHFSRNSQEET